MPRYKNLAAELARKAGNPYFIRSVGDQSRSLSHEHALDRPVAGSLVIFQSKNNRFAMPARSSSESWMERIRSFLFHERQSEIMRSPPWGMFSSFAVTIAR